MYSAALNNGEKLWRLRMQIRPLELEWPLVILEIVFSIKWWAPISDQKELKTKYNLSCNYLTHAFLKNTRPCKTEKFYSTCKENGVRWIALKNSVSDTVKQNKIKQKTLET